MIPIPLVWEKSSDRRHAIQASRAMPSYEAAAEYAWRQYVNDGRDDVTVIVQNSKSQREYQCRTFCIEGVLDCMVIMYSRTDPHSGKVTLTTRHQTRTLDKRLDILTR